MTNLGHCHPRVVAAVREQLGRLMHVSNLFYTEPAMRLASALSRLEPRRQGVLLQLRRGGQRGGDQAARARPAPGRRCGGRPRRLPRAHLRRPVGDAAGGQAGAVRAARAGLSRGRARGAGAGGGGRRAHGGGDARADPGRERRARALRGAAAGGARGLRRARRGARSSTRSSAAWAARAACGPTSRPACVPDAITTAKALGGGLPIGALVTGERLADVLRAGRSRLDLRRRARRRGGRRSRRWS